MAVNAKNWQELKKPNMLEKKMGAGDVRRRAVFVAEPLERGFGMTLGNSLRRVLLSSLQGAAVTSIKIDGVLHEFSSLAGVREDVTDIVLNVKQIALKMEGEGPKRLHLSATGLALQRVRLLQFLPVLCVDGHFHSLAVGGFTAPDFNVFRSRRRPGSSPAIRPGGACSGARHCAGSGSRHGSR